MELVPGDVIASADWATTRWSPTPADRWVSCAQGAEWTPRRTLDHLVDSMLLYSAYIATRARARLTPPRDGDRSSTPDALLDAFRSSAMILSRLLEGVQDEERAFHPSGLADRSGWIGMACTEILVHTEDATAGWSAAAADFPVALADAVVDRVLPWTPRLGDGKQRLLWATGRCSLGGLAPSGADWWWQSAPLAEWDGAPRHRTAPPQW